MFVFINIYIKVGLRGFHDQNEEEFFLRIKRKVPQCKTRLLGHENLLLTLLFVEYITVLC